MSNDLIMLVVAVGGTVWFLLALFACAFRVWMFVNRRRILADWFRGASR